LLCYHVYGEIKIITTIYQAAEKFSKIWQTSNDWTSVADSIHARSTNNVEIIKCSWKSAALIYSLTLSYFGYSLVIFLKSNCQRDSFVVKCANRKLKIFLHSICNVENECTLCELFVCVSYQVIQAKFYGRFGFLSSHSDYFCHATNWRGPYAISESVCLFVCLLHSCITSKQFETSK